MYDCILPYYLNPFLNYMYIIICSVLLRYKEQLIYYENT